MRKLLLAGIAAAAVGFTGAASAANMDNPMVKPTVEPGKVVVRLDTQVNFWAGVSSDKANKNINGGKNQQYGFDGYVRLYSTMDAMTTNGVKYGAAVEIRTNSNAGKAAGTSGSSNSAAETFYARRAYGYVGTDQLGTIRFGQIDGVLGLMKVGDQQGFGDGGLNGDVPDFAPSISAWQFPFSVGGEYATNKLIYLSPSFGGFDFGVSFAPSQAGLLGAVSAAGAGGSFSQSTSPTILGVQQSDARARNILELNARYRGNFGAAGVAANVGYVTSGKVNDGTASRGLSIIDAGVSVSAAGFTVGGHFDTGRFNGQNNLSAAGEKDAMMYIIGALYQNGPYTIGAHYINDSLPGTLGNGVARKTNAGSIGGNWGWAPGAELWFEAMTGTVTEGPTKSHGTGVIIAQRFRW
jgi:hypothetical protein